METVELEMEGRTANDRSHGTVLWVCGMLCAMRTDTTLQQCTVRATLAACSPDEVETFYSWSYPELEHVDRDKKGPSAYFAPITP